MPAHLRTGKNQVTLARALSKLGVVSRKEAENVITGGRVRVNSLLVRAPQTWVDLKKDKLSLDGKLLRRVRPLYLAMNKPAGVVTTRSDERGRKTVYEFLPQGAHWLFPVGRLDKETSGLLLFTNDTRFGDLVSNPLASVPKTYRVEVDKPLSADDRNAMESEVILKDGTRIKPARIAMIDSCRFRMTVSEGKNRQIRRVCEMLGYQVLRLQRTAIGNIELGHLSEGNVRTLTEAERTSLAVTAASRVPQAVRL